MAIACSFLKLPWVPPLLYVAFRLLFSRLTLLPGVLPLDPLAVALLCMPGRQGLFLLPLMLVADSASGLSPLLVLTRGVGFVFLWITQGSRLSWNRACFWALHLSWWTAAAANAQSLYPFAYVFSCSVAMQLLFVILLLPKQNEFSLTQFLMDLVPIPVLFLTWLLSGGQLKPLPFLGTNSSAAVQILAGIGLFVPWLIWFIAQRHSPTTLDTTSRDPLMSEGNTPKVYVSTST